MDRNTLTVLTSDIETQMALIETIFARLEERAAGLEPDDEAKTVAAWQMKSRLPFRRVPISHEYSPHLSPRSTNLAVGSGMSRARVPHPASCLLHPASCLLYHENLARL